MKIQSKLFFILFSFSLLLVTILVLLMQWSIGKGMVEYVNTKEIEILKPLVVDLANEYQKDGSWSAIQGNKRIFDKLLFSALENSGLLPPKPHAPSSHMRPPPENDFSTTNIKYQRPREPKDKASYALLDNNKNFIAGRYKNDFEYSTSAIVVKQITVGFLAVSKRNQLTNGYELEFIEQQQSYFWIIALATMVLVALVTLPLARHIVEPLKQITQGMRKLTQGHYLQKIELQRQDEFGELSRYFNELALTLDKNESARKRWLANISHELRTPMAILRGELEAMLDDVRPLIKKNINSANDEVKHLQNLIDDLHQLTCADIGGMHYRKKNEDLTLLLNSENSKYVSYLGGANIKLETKIESGNRKAPLIIFVDKTRLCQLFENIINNSIKYSQASLVKLTVSTDEKSLKPMIIIKFEDNGIGVDKQHFSHLFEHLYRVEGSRNRQTGGSGLGLSICAHIVAAHQGEIFADRSCLGGLAIIIKLPLSQ